jgi:hypothetical protein
MAAKFTPVSMDLIDEGRFAQQVQDDFRNLQAEMVRYADEHGELAYKSKGKLVIEINVQCDSPKDKAFTIKALTKTTVPNSPASVSVAMGEQDDDDKPALFVRAAGSSKAPPKQGILTTQDGKRVDTDTGEVIGD